MMPKLFLVNDMQRELGELIVKLAATRKRLEATEKTIAAQRQQITNLRRRVTEQGKRIGKSRAASARRKPPADEPGLTHDTIDGGAVSH